MTLKFLFLFLNFQTLMFVFPMIQGIVVRFICLNSIYISLQLLSSLLELMLNRTNIGLTLGTCMWFYNALFTDSFLTIFAKRFYSLIFVNITKNKFSEVCFNVFRQFGHFFSSIIFSKHSLDTYFIQYSNMCGFLIGSL